MRRYPIILCFLLILFFRTFAVDSANSTSPKRPPADNSKDKKNENEDVTFNTTLIDSELVDVLWCGDSGESVLVVTELGSVYYSSNSGMNWAKLSKIFQSTAKKKTTDNDEEVIANFLE